MLSALNGIKVIDVAQVAAVPMCARHLADFGAEVLHIEHPVRGDSWRGLQAGQGGNAGIPSDFNYNFEAFNRNKRSVAIDISQPRGTEIIHKLVARADVFLTNLRFWERDKYRLAYGNLKEVNTKIVYGSVTGHGAKGADRDLPAYDTTVYWGRGGVAHTLALPGLQGLNARPAFGDVVAGLALAYGVMMALYTRDKYGFGQEVQTSLFETALYQLTFDVSAALATHQDENVYRLENFDGSGDGDLQRKRLISDAMATMRKLMDFGRQRAPNPLANAYETSDGVVIRFNALLADKYWPIFCRITDHNALLADPRFSSTELRKTNRKELYSVLKAAFLKKTFAEWKPAIADIPYSISQDLTQVIDDPQAHANEAFLEVEHPVHGKIRVLNNLVRMSQSPATYRMSAPEFSQHTEEVMLELGYTWDDISSLKEQGVLG